MDDLKSLTVRSLRELARKYLGKGHSRLKTKEELVQALRKLVPSIKELAPTRKAPGARPRKPSPEEAAAEAATPEAEPVTAPPVAAPPKEPSEVQHAAEPIVEGFFVARVAGEGEARRHHLTEEFAAVRPAWTGYDEQLGELPSSYDDDAAVLLPRDPHTLFFFWDFRIQTRELAATGLPDPRGVIRVYEGAELVRELDFAFESKSFYIHNLPPGRIYRIEAHFVGSDGRTRRVGRSTNVVALPGVGPSSDTTVRLLRIPWDLPLSRLRQLLKDGTLTLTELEGEFEDLTGRHALPSSASWPRRPGEGPGIGERGWIPPPSGRPY